MAEAPPAEAAEAHRPPPVWLFALLIPYGVVGSFASATVGKIMKLHHGSQTMATLTVYVPIAIAGLAFLYAPTVDLWLRRRTWYILFCTVAGAILLAAQYVLPTAVDPNATSAPPSVNLYVWLIFASQVAICLANAGIGGLMATTVPDEQRGRASGFANFGNVGMGAITGGLTLQLIESETARVPLVGVVSSYRAVGWVIAILCVLPAFLVLIIDEPAPPKRTVSELFGRMGHQVWSTVKQRSGWSGILLCISPVGTAAAMQIFTTFDKSYDASPRMTTIVNGYLGGFLTGAACLLGGWICDRVDRRAAYLVSGALTAVVAAAMALSPMTPFTYAWAALTYLFVTGFCYAAFTAFVLQVVGQASAGASTRYTLFTSAGNLAIFWVGLVDNVGFGFWDARHAGQGPRGLLVMDAILNLVGIVVFLGLLRLLRPSSAPVPAANAT